MKTLNTITNKRHLMFVVEYLNTKDILASYKKIYPTASDTSAYSSAYRILGQPEVKAFIESQTLRALNEFRIKADALSALQELEKVAFSSLRNKQKVTALVKYLDIIGLSEGVGALVDNQKAKAEAAIEEFKNDFTLDELDLTQMHNVDLRDYLDLYDIEYSERDTKKTLINLLESAVEAHQEDLASQEDQASKDNKASQEK